MLPLKNVRFYKSEIAFIFVFVEEIFVSGKSQKNNFSIVEEGYLFCKKLYDLRNNKCWYKLNKFLPQNDISGLLNGRDK